jgi:dTMP kinase
VSSDQATATRWERLGARADAPDHDVRGVLAIRPFRQLWLSLGLSSFGDWLGLLATTAMASLLGGQSSYAAANLAVAGVLILRLAPAIFFGPIAGAVADRLDRKVTMVVGDVLRFGLFASIPIIGTLWWLFVATVLIEIVGLFWMPAKDATVPNLVPRQRLEAANQLSLATTYGSAPFAALMFSGLTLLAGVLDNFFDFIGGPIDVAMHANALTYLVAALVIWRLDMPRRPAGAQPATERASVWHTIVDGWRFVGTTPLVRGLVIGMLGAFGAGGFVIGVAPSFVHDLGAGEPGYGILFAAVFTGLALGMWVGPRLLAELPRWRMFSLSIVVAGCFLVLVALIPNIVLAALFTASVGAGAGVAWVTGYTMLGLEVADELRGRTFAFVQSSARVVLVAVMAFAPALAALLGRHEIRFGPQMVLTYNGAALTLLVAAVLAVSIGLLSYRQMDDGSGVPLAQDVLQAWQKRHLAAPLPVPRTDQGYFIALEGGDGAGKSTQARLLQAWLADEVGHEVVLTHEPGATPTGQRLRELLLHGDDLAPRAEALMFAADRAQHVATVVRPALERGAMVVTDRFLDSSIAYQGAGRALDPAEIAQLSRWATGGLLPDMTVLLDVAPEVGRGRVGADADRLERESAEFHTAVRERFLELARQHPRRYLVVDASQPAEAIHEQVRQRLEPLLPLSPRQRAEARAREEQARREEEERRAAEEEQRRLAEEARRQEEARRAAEEEARRLADEQERARLAAEEEARRQAEEARRQAEVVRRHEEAELARRRREEQARIRREAEERAHHEAVRRARGGDDDTSTRTLPVVDPPTRELDLRDELFSLGDDEPGQR